MMHRFRAGVPLALVAVALIVVALSLSACVSDSSGQAMDPPPTPTDTAVPTVPVPPTPTTIPIDPNKPAAIVAGTPIPGSAFAAEVAQVRIIYAQDVAQQPGAAMPTEKQIRSAAIDDLIQRAVVRLYAQRHHITVTPAEVQEQYILSEAQNGGPAAFPGVLKSYGYTVKSYKSRLADSILQQKVAQQIHPLPLVDAVDARHILVALDTAGHPYVANSSGGSGAKLDFAKSKVLADKLYKELQRDPGKFAALARQYSTDTGSAPVGGELGYFPRGEMVAPFQKVAFSLKVGQISAPVKSQFGYHIIQVEAHQKVPPTELNAAAQQQPPYQQEIQRQQTAFQTWYTAERKRDHVRILVPDAT